MKLFKIIKWLLLLWIFPLALLVFLTSQKTVPLGYIMAEPQAIMGLPWYTGAFAVLVGTLWFAAAAIAFFTASVAALARAPLVFMGLFSLWLGCDDLLMLHESFFPSVLSGGYLGGHVQPMVFTCYGVIMLGCLFMDRAFLRRLEALPLYLALILFAISMGLDSLGESGLAASLNWSWLSKLLVSGELVEDWFKLFGLVTWVYYFALRSRIAILESADHNI